MLQNLQTVIDLISNNNPLSAEEKAKIIASLKEADKKIAITEFKLERTEKVKRTTAILLEETIEELENKRKAVEAQNHELEIESALERVRTIAMSMNKADDMLDVCKVISNQLELLNVKEIRNVQTAIFYKEKGTYMNYEYYAKHDKTIITETSYTNSEMHSAFAAQMMKGAGESFATYMNGAEVKDWIAHQKTTNVFIDNYLETAASLNYYWHSLGPVALGISTYNPLRAEDISLFKRFLKVFELSYRRYLDIEKAEAQAREAQIEAALEKVRSRSLAMHKSDELNEVVTVLFEKLKELKITVTAVGIHIYIPGSKDLNVYVCGQGENGLVINNYRLPYFEHIIANDLNNAGEKQLDFFVGNYSKKEKNSFYKYVFEHSSLHLPDDIKKLILESPAYTISLATVKNSMIAVNDFEGKYLSENETDIIKRFAKVFEQAYVRFLDLKKAEAQSRESQIQLALERARAQSMMMQHSTELDDTLRVFHEQVLQLNIPSAFSFLWLPDEDKDRHIFWAAWAENNSFKSKAINYPLDKNEPATAQCLIDWKSNEPVVSYHVPPEGVENYFAAWNELIASVDELQPQYFSDGLYYVEAFMKYGCFGVMVKSELNEDEKKILERFAIEFERAYTRFLDLQKAEAQAREAQIELGLERVRARAMAMQTSEELSELIGTLFAELTKLDLKLTRCTIWIFDEKTNDARLWMANSEDPIHPVNYFMPFHQNTTFLAFLNAWNKRTLKWEYTLRGEAKKNWDDYLFSKTELSKLPDFIKAGMRASDKVLFSASFNNFGGIHAASLEALSEEHFNVLLRFAKVFDLTYTRFNDLKQAEAQTRESQIQLALERVRARTMAMQKSNELGDASFVLDSQVRALGIKTRGCAFNIYGEKESTEWFSSEMGTMPAYKTPRENIFLTYYEAGKTGVPLYMKEFDGEACATHYDYLCTIPALGDGLREMIRSGGSFPSQQTDHVTYFKYGYLLFITLEPEPEAHDIFIRFAKVFEQTYTRFLDLQKAEAQAKESQIQLALERVRARTMAMQRSDELQEAASLMFQQIEFLGAPTWNCSFNIWTEDKKYAVAWNATKEGFGRPFYSSSSEDVFLEFYTAAQQGKELFIKEIGGQELEQHYQYLSAVPGVGETIAELKAAGIALPTFQIFNIAYFTQGYLMFITYKPVPELWDIFKRFAKVFEQTYTRFLDLQKAEAQAREAEIELGLERVRARAMAMQTSEELNPLIGTVFTELTKLDLLLTRCVILIYEGNTKGVRWWMANSETPSTPMNFFVKYADMPFFNEYFKGWYNRELKWQYCLEGENKIKTDNFLFTETELSLLPDFVVEGMKAPDRVYLNASFNNFGNLTLATLEPLSEEHFNILLRFAKVFDLTYTRFNDLQKAEAQAREAKIEAALERVRSRSMGMQKSEELKEVIQVVYEQFVHLNINTEHTGFVMDYKATDDRNIWVASKYGLPSQFTIPYFDSLYYNSFNKAKEKGLDFFATNLSFDEKNIFYKELFKYIPGIPEDDMKFYFSCPGLAISTVLLDNVGLYIENFSGIPYSDEDNKTLMRFGNVFQQTYTRFLDLKIAEAQVRESQIQLALERVRARTMAMQKQNDLLQVLDLLVEQLVKLGVHLEVANFSKGIPGGDWDLWIDVVTDDGTIYNNYVHFPRIDHPYFSRVEKNIEVFRNGGTDLFKDVFSKAEKDSWQDYINKQTIYKDITPEQHKQIMYDKTGYTWSMILLKDTWVSICRFSTIPFSDEEDVLLRRFANAFGQAYTRYLDLQKAEAQAKEAQIEAALERVRSRSLAMHKSEEIIEVAKSVFEKLDELNIELNTAFIIIFKDGSRDSEWWLINRNDQQYSSIFVKYIDMLILREQFEAKEQGKELFAATYYGEEKKELFRYLFTQTDFKYAPPARQQFIFETDAVSISMAMTNKIAIQITRHTHKPFSNEENEIVKRFTKVFDQSYTRFLDLQKAEAQAREAQIEAALERVRGKAMAMHSSTDLAETIHLFYHEIELLSVTPRRCGVGLLNKETRVCKLSTMTTTEEGEPVEVIGKLDLQGHPVLDGIYNNWFYQKEYHPVLRGNEIKEYYKLIRPQISYPDYPNDMAQYGYFFFFPEGGVFAWTEKELPEAELQIYRRFTSVLSLAYKRCNELTIAEANAREAVKQSALDRIRADIASMRTINDLDRITPLIWNELTILGVPFIRCGAFIMNDEQQRIHTFLSTPDGKAIAAFHIPYNTPGNIKHVINHWRENKNYIDHWDEDAFTTFAKTLVEQGALTSAKQYLQTIPHGGFYLHFLPFLQGMLYVGNTNQLSEDEINLIQSLADAFSTAYARYEDFNKLEAAKKQVDKTLVELKQTQQQLVQSEKMASLGELTAGIAHEIQNPLNFVNNFSEVSKELIDEMRIALENGDKEEAEQIASDIIQNLEKINHHGKRADAIVKNMLQHSRKNSGQKEPTDINALCDEYLRLSFHGLRAKDKSFNADFKTDFDESLSADEAGIGKINIVPQDIGRVLLNLFNNAFYAINEKLKNLTGLEDLTGLVTVQTKKINDKVEIVVTDNGNGIPQNIIDKIFQPFFTTKPTGSGTGLGLSLAYDIITKEHNGIIKVESKEGEGTMFIINLPV